MRVGVLLNARQAELAFHPHTHTFLLMKTVDRVLLSWSRVLQPCTVKRAPYVDTSRWPKGQVVVRDVKVLHALKVIPEEAMDDFPLKTCHTTQKKLSLSGN
eukprot:4665955-Amphidinium_carterae.1